MDVHCSTCGEPWDVAYLSKEAVYETNLSFEEAACWLSLSREKKLEDYYRTLFREAHWEFGRSMINVIHCPCCPKDAKPDSNLLKTKAGLEQLFADDEDGLAATFEDYRL
jgi:hypothetical protein